MSEDGYDSEGLRARGRAVIDRQQYMTLATSDMDGTPWASPVFYVADGYSTFYWISSPEATQVRNISARPEIGIVVFDSRQQPGTGEAVYLVATAGELTGAELDRGLDVYLGAAPFGKGRDAFRAPGRFRAYRADVTAHFMLCPLASGAPCPVHGRTSDHRIRVSL